VFEDFLFFMKKLSKTAFYSWRQRFLHPWV